MSLADGYRIVALRSGSVDSGVPSSKQKFRDVSVYVRLQVGQRFILFRVQALAWSEQTVGKIIGKVPHAQALIGFPQRPQNFVPAG